VDNRKDLATEGYLPTLLEVMKTKELHAELLQHALFALMGLSATGEEEKKRRGGGGRGGLRGTRTQRTTRN